MTLESLLVKVKTVLNRSLTYLTEGGGDAEDIERECGNLEYFCVAHREAAEISQAVKDGLGAAVLAITSPDMPADHKEKMQEFIRAGLAALEPKAGTPRP